jgi:hypothetical protein
VENGGSIEVTIHRPMPVGLCPACQAEAVKTGFQYCDHNGNQVGALYNTTPAGSIWQIWTPVTMGCFLFMAKMILDFETAAILPPAVQPPISKKVCHD